jgi:ADP-ribosyl-[dinitrogen reductase] hydrolase
MLLEIGIGDAYGASFEFAPREFIDAHNTLDQYLTNPVFGAIGEGRYTDDTQMSLALAEHIIDGAEFTHVALADRFFHVFKRDPRLGYSGILYKILMSSDTSNQMMERIKGNGEGSGAAMRACPLGVYGNIDTIKQRSDIQARVTHNSDHGIVSSRAVALASHFFIRDLGRPMEVLDFVNQEVGIIDWSNWTPHEAQNKGIPAAHAAINIAARNLSYRDILRNSVALGGDVDTIAAVAMGLASCSSHHEREIPQELVDGFETSTYGHNYLKLVGAQLDRVAIREILSPTS